MHHHEVALLGPRGILQRSQLQQRRIIFHHGMILTLLLLPNQPINRHILPLNALYNI